MPGIVPLAWSNDCRGWRSQVGGAVAATPISIPRPIKPRKKAAAPAGTVKNQTSAAQYAVRGIIDSCELNGVNNKEMILRIKYRVDPSVKGTVYSGAFLYTDDGQAVGAGYKPAAVASIPAGIIDIIMVLPEKAFKSGYINTFLINSGKIFVNQRFYLPFSWNGSSGKFAGAGVQKAVPANRPGSVKQGFCRVYADRAISQYSLAKQYKLPNIMPPVWSDNWNNHFQWCMRVPQGNARQGRAGQGTAMRENVLNK